MYSYFKVAFLFIVNYRRVPVVIKMTPIISYKYYFLYTICQLVFRPNYYVNCSNLAKDYYGWLVQMWKFLLLVFTCSCIFEFVYITIFTCNSTLDSQATACITLLASEAPSLKRLLVTSLQNINCNNIWPDLFLSPLHIKSVNWVREINSLIY